MNKIDPDLKVHMSLDEIIHMSKRPKPPSLNGTTTDGRMKKRKRQRRRSCPQNSDHSIPYFSSLGGGFIFVSKKSPLLKAAERREIEIAVSNRVLNSKLIESTREIIPANYKLIKTSKGVERILVPIDDYILNKNKPKASPRKVCDCSVKSSSSIVVNNKQPNVKKSPDKNYTNAKTLPQDAPIKMEVDDDSDDDIIILENYNKNETKPKIIDVESNTFVCTQEENQRFVLGKTIQTLNDRFTMLSKSVQSC